MEILRRLRGKEKTICLRGKKMKLCLINNSYKYELEKLIRIFLPFEKIEFCFIKIKEDRTAVTELIKDAEKTRLSAKLFLSGERYAAEYSIENSNSDYDKECERLLAAALYDCFVKASGYVPQWGILTGVRPAKLFSRLCAANGESAAEDWFKNALYVNDNKISLCKETVT